MVDTNGGRPPIDFAIRQRAVHGSPESGGRGVHDSGNRWNLLWTLLLVLSTITGVDGSPPCLGGRLIMPSTHCHVVLTPPIQPTKMVSQQIRGRTPEGEREAASRRNSSCKDLRVEYDSVCQRGATAQRNNGFCDGYERVCGGITASVDSKTVVSYKNTPTKGDTKTMRRSVDMPPLARAERKSMAVNVDRNTNNHEEATASSVMDLFAGNNDVRQRKHEAFCAKYRQRFLYVCPNPLQFGGRALVFCPVYAERCREAAATIPNESVVPTERSEELRLSKEIYELCRQFQQFATTFCFNIFAFQMLTEEKRRGCEKYQRFCMSGDNVVSSR